MSVYDYIMLSIVQANQQPAYSYKNPCLNLIRMEKDFQERLIDMRDIHRVKIRRQSKTRMLQQKRHDRLQTLSQEQYLHQSKRKIDWQELLTLIDKRICQEPEQCLRRLCESIQDPDDCDALMGTLDEIGIRIANIGLQFMHIKQGAFLIGNMVSAYPISSYLLSQHAVAKCISLIREIDDIEATRRWTWVLYQLVAQCDNLQNTNLLLISQNYPLLLQKTKNSKHYNMLISKLTHERRYLPDTDMVVRTLFETAVSNQLTKRTPAIITLGNLIRRGKSANFLPFINEYVQFCQSLLDNKYQTKRYLGKQYLRILIDHTGEELVHCIFAKRVLERLVDHFPVETPDEIATSLGIVSAAYAYLSPSDFECVTENKVLEYISKEGLTSEWSQVVKQSILALLNVIRSIPDSQTTDVCGILMRYFNVGSVLQRLCFDENRELSQLATQVYDLYFKCFEKN